MHIGHRDTEGRGGDLAYLGVESLAHLRASVGHQHRPIRVARIDREWIGIWIGETWGGKRGNTYIIIYENIEMV
jgi:hypothetical protein